MRRVKIFSGFRVIFTIGNFFSKEVVVPYFFSSRKGYQQGCNRLTACFNAEICELYAQLDLLNLTTITKNL